MANIARNESFNLQRMEIEMGVGAASFLIGGRSRFFLVLQWISSFFRESHATESSSHSFILYLIPVLKDFLVLKYQGKPNTPFETHPISMYAAITTFFAYFIISGTMLRIWRSHHFRSSLHQFLIWISGYFSVASLTSILYPEAVAFLPYVAYFVLAIVKFLHLIVSNETILEKLRFIELNFQESLATQRRRLMSFIEDQSPVLPLYVVRRNTGSIRP